MKIGACRRETEVRYEDGAMTPEDRQTIIESTRALNTQLEKANPSRTVREATDLFEEAGVLKCWDSDLPALWWERARVRLGEAPPAGIVWCYDGPLLLGEPFALNEEAQSYLDRLEKALGS